MRPVFTDPTAPCASAYLEHYLESVEALPHDLQRSFTQLREIDLRLQDYNERLDIVGHSDLTQLYQLDTVERQHRLAEIQSLLETCLQYGVEKERIALQTYEMVDKHVRKLDQDAESYEQELKDPNKKPAEKAASAPISTPGASAGAGAGGPVKRIHSSKESIKDKAREKPPVKKTKKERPPPQPLPKPESSQQPAMPPKTLASKGGKSEGPGELEHDDTKYCICEQVSYGEMVGCDNETCPVEWFHFQCVNLTAKPKGKWFCPECRGEVNKAAKTR